MDGMLERLKRLLGADGTALQDALDDAVGLVLAYCNLTELPQALEGVVVRLAADLYRGTGYGSAYVPAPVASVTRGDVSTSFAVRAGSALGEPESEMIDRYRDILNGYRKLRR